MRAWIFTLLFLTLGPGAIGEAGVLTPAPDGTPMTPTCPSGEFPSAGALDITDGTVLWAACSPDETYRTVIGGNDSIVLIDEQGPDGMRTVAFDAGTGVERWHRATGIVPFPPGPPIAQGPIDGQGIVVLATDDGDGPALIGVDALTGEERWRVASPDVPLAHSAKAAVVGDAPSPGATVRFRGIDRTTGEELWVGATPLTDMS
ncbi:MAG TPA: PQQ-binding-like beta-propeller repeat protein, partial [Thermomicrobiales bacterium]|nr:PQQ-binding-like beta-propeller repeat protein [Thermomicrobiales bacterium]